VGAGVGFFVGEGVGLLVGLGVGRLVGRWVGVLVGLLVGRLVGAGVGFFVGEGVGLLVGLGVRRNVGAGVGFFVGLFVGNRLGAKTGLGEGSTNGRLVATTGLSVFGFIVGMYVSPGLIGFGLVGVLSVLGIISSSSLRVGLGVVGTPGIWVAGKSLRAMVGWRLGTMEANASMGGSPGPVSSTNCSFWFPIAGVSSPVLPIPANAINRPATRPAMTSNNNVITEHTRQSPNREKNDRRSRVMGTALTGSPNS
jgi:hypothetical protein